MLAGEGKIRQLFFQRVEEGHASCDVESKANGLRSIDYQARALVQDSVEWTVDHVLVDYDQIRRVIATANDG